MARRARGRIAPRQAGIPATVVVTLLTAALAESAAAQGAPDPSLIVRQLREDAPRADQLAAATLAWENPGTLNAPEVRAALIAALEREGRLRARRRSGEVGEVEAPELVARLALALSDVEDPRVIPGLVGVLGIWSSVNALGRFGEPAVEGVIAAVLSPESDGPRIRDGLVALRFMVERADQNPLSEASVRRLTSITPELLRHPYDWATLWFAIDLAAALDTPELRATLEAIASNDQEVQQRVRPDLDADLVLRTRQRAADRLAGVPPLPRWRSTMRR